MSSDNIYLPQKKQKLNDTIDLSTLLRYPSLMGFGTFNVYDPAVIINALRIGYRHFDLAESYDNLAMVKTALDLATSPIPGGGFGLSTKNKYGFRLCVAQSNSDQ
jgi:diketogulonate reductase-like aldo/keto reductase